MRGLKLLPELPKGFVLRRATNADAKAIRGLIWSVLAEYGLGPDPDATDSDLYDIETEYWNNGGEFYALEKDSTLVGATAVFKLSDETCEIRKMYLLPFVRGLGIGKLLLEYSLERARALGFKHVQLETAKALIEAKALYKKYGFKLLDEPAQSCRCDEVYRLEIA